MINKFLLQQSPKKKKSKTVQYCLDLHSVIFFFIYVLQFFNTQGEFFENNLTHLAFIKKIYQVISHN